VTNPNPEREPAELVRPYVITRGRGHPTNSGLDIITLIITNGDVNPPITLGPEKLRIIELCRGGYLSIAEVAAQLELSIAITRVLLSDMLDARYVLARAPIPRAMAVDERILQEVLDGLARL
jgi:hypothetical protein